MRLLIDNLDGAGATDYSAAMAAAGRLVLERVLNAPSVCRVALVLEGTVLKTPVRRARVVVTNDTGTVLFTGYLRGEPEQRCVGASTQGEDSLLLLMAESDDWLLDQQGASVGGAGFGLSGAALLSTLTSRTDPQRFTTSAAGVTRSLGLFAPDGSRVWSANAAAVASGAYAAYRVIAGVVDLLPGGAVTHTLRREDGTLDPTTLELRSPRALVNDVTVSGEREPATYVTEVFSGDGTTTEFDLDGVPFRLTTTQMRVPLDETFQAAAFDPRLWQVADPGSHLSVTSAGLTMSGGTGLDGETTLVAIDAVELGGTLVLEAGGVLLNAGSDGVVCGVYSGPVSRTNCVAGFDVTQNAGSTVVSALVNGAPAGTAVTLQTGHEYVLRLHLHSVEVHRVQQTYSTMVNGQIESFGGGLVAAQVDAVFEMQDLGLASNTPATVLFDGSLRSAPASASFAAVDSVQLSGSVNYVRITRGGPVWVRSTTGATTWTRLLGTAGDGLDAELTGSNRLRFFAGRVPAAGETIEVMHRSSERAVARLQNTASITAEGAANLPGVAVWTGQVTEPVTRNSVDCANAAAALLVAGTSRTAAIEGQYTAQNPADIWPGDVLEVEGSSGGALVPLMVRKVTVEDELSLPEWLVYRIEFANDWANSLSIRTTPHLAVDVSLPVAVSGAPLPENLAALRVVSVTGTAIQVDTGTAPPVGGGFEVRRRDGSFGAGVGQDFVLRSPVRGFSIPRAAQTEHYFVRMYDASAEPQYSRFSSALYTHVPVG